MSPEPKLAMHTNAAVSSTLPSAALDDLNWMRGLAAIAVLAGHVRGLFFVDYEAARKSAFSSAAYLVTGLGHQAVVVFFVLSGFFIGSSVVVTTQDGSWSWSRFALRRATRLYVVIVPALLLTLAWDSLGLHLFGTDGIYGGNIVAPSLTLPVVRTALTLPVFFGNLAFLQSLLVAPFGSNGPLWSLSYEAWAYLMFPLLFRAAYGSEARGMRALFALAALVALAVGGGLFRFYFVVWCLGAVVAILWSRGAFRRVGAVPAAAAFAAFGVLLVLARLRRLGSHLEADFVLGCGTAVFVASRLARHAFGRTPGALPSPPRRHYSRWGNLLAGFSFTLYAIHYPLVTFFQAWLVGKQRWTPDLVHTAEGVAFGIAILVFYAYPIARLTEARTDAARRIAERAIERATSALRGDASRA